MIRLYIERSLKKNQDIFLEGMQSHYLQNVMRLKKGDSLLLFNGQDGEWKAVIQDISRKDVRVTLFDLERPQKRERDFCLLFSPLKPKRQEFLIEKATELGVSCLQPVLFERASIRKVNLEKIAAHSREAAEQSGRLTIPEIKPLVSLPSLLKAWPETKPLFFGDESMSSPYPSTLTHSLSNGMAFMVGPEGGFTSKEFSLLTAHKGVQGITLNPHILRAETAALAGVAYFQAAFPDA